MRLYLMQHGKASSEDQDPARPLTAEGRTETEAMARFLSRTARPAGVRIRHSGKTRARQTAQALARAFDETDVDEAEGLGPLDDPAVWAAQLAGSTEPVMLVGHLPHLPDSPPSSSPATAIEVSSRFRTPEWCVSSATTRGAGPCSGA